jgi:uncharacterized protein
MRLLLCSRSIKKNGVFCRSGIVLLLVLFLFMTSGCTKKEDVPKVLQRQGWVSDYADVLKPEEKTRISYTLETYEKETCHQVYLLIIPALEGENIADFSTRTASVWEIGQPGFGNGLLITIALQEGSVRFEAGSAFEWFIQNGTADKILKEVMIPFFREDRLVEGIERGLEEIMVAGRLKEIPDDHKPAICRQ